MSASEEPLPASTTADVHAACARSVGAYRFTIMILSSTVIAMAAGLLESLAGAGLPAAVRSGGTTFVTVVGLCFTAVTVLRELRKRL
ncbi:hypothetical protein ACN20G_36730 (plasmid) [Streptomyces sp. BI20]|uniref:hypothetical protein n=1 Tax=Streptomyces sp. BI20 TaxID=3403460 RepID=UPI003C7102DE